MPVSTPFADQSAQCNRDVVSRLANAVLLNGGEETAVCFSEADFSAKRNPVEPGAGREWRAGAPLTDFGALPPRKGAEVEINGVAYVVGKGPLVDSTGWATYFLSRK